MARKKGSKNPNAGRKTDYRVAYNKQVEKLCKLGATDVEIADFFEVTERTLNTWKKQYPKFLQSIKSGKITADLEVADKLHTRATGYDIEESYCDITEELVCPISTDDKGKFKSKLAQAQQDFEQFKTTEDAKTVKYKKNEHKSMRHIPADTTAAIFWLKNRRPKDWRDKQEHELTGKDGKPIETTVNTKEINELQGQLKELAEMMNARARKTSDTTGTDNTSEKKLS